MANISLENFKSNVPITWCPGCGNYLILNALQKALAELNLPQEQVAMVYGIGCAGNMADFNTGYGFHALHGRGIPVAVGIKLANHDLKVIVAAGDGDLYGEGLGHLLAAARGNHDITVIAHNNGRYSLTTGQASPTSHKGLKAKSTPTGLIETPFNPLLSALSVNATFVARGYSTQMMQLVELFKQAILHPGFALVDVMQLCPSFNKEMNHPWFASRIYDLAAAGHDRTNLSQAMAKAMEPEKIGLGIYYQNPESKPYHAQVPQLDKGNLLSQFTSQIDLKSAIQSMI